MIATTATTINNARFHMIWLELSRQHCHNPKKNTPFLKTPSTSSRIRHSWKRHYPTKENTSRRWTKRQEILRKQIQFENTFYTRHFLNATTHQHASNNNCLNTNNDAIHFRFTQSWVQWRWRRQWQKHINEHANMMDKSRASYSSPPLTIMWPLPSILTLSSIKKIN